MIREASPRAISTKAGSFKSVRAWSGVLERKRRVQVCIPPGASKVVRKGFGVARQKNV